MTFGQHRHRRIMQSVILRFAMISLDAHIFGIYRTEMQTSRDLKGVTHRNLMPILISNLDITDAYLGPILSHLRLPLTHFGGSPPAIARELAMRLSRRDVKLFGIIFHHPMGVKNRCHTSDRFAHELDPGDREFAIGLGIIERDNLILEQLIEAGSIDFVLKLGIALRYLCANSPPILAVVTFAPPAVEHTQVKT